jgi:arginyl-tRNA synthetase
MAEKKSAAEPKFLLYKEKPLVRSENTIYYGSPAEKYVILLQILTAKDESGLEVPTGKVSVTLFSTDENLKPKDRIVKKTEKESFYTALDIGVVWLQRALGES